MLSKYRGLPEAVSRRTISPESTVRTGLSDASKNPRWTVATEAFSS